jgi:type VI secretion system protein ImpF
MAELTNRERLQPSLLDRLADDDPKNPRESRESRVLSVERLRMCVLRDLKWLLNSENMASSFDLEEYPEVAKSVLNFGRPALSGKSSSSVTLNEIRDQFRQAILTFEPRILPETLRITPFTSDDGGSPHQLSFRIEGQLWAQPLPLNLFLRTELDLETGNLGLYEE